MTDKGPLFAVCILQYRGWYSELPPKCWAYRYQPPRQVNLISATEPRALGMFVPHFTERAITVDQAGLEVTEVLLPLPS